MNRIINVVASVPESKSRYDCDFADRLCYPYTTILFTVLAVVVSTKQFVGEPIQCWVPGHFTGNHEDYANDYCWLGNTYYLPADSGVPKEDEVGHQPKVSYYHWIQLLLLVQALFFYLPTTAWRLFVRQSGLDMEDLIRASDTYGSLELEETREKTMEFMKMQMDRYLSTIFRYQSSKGKNSGVFRRSPSTRSSSNQNSCCLSISALCSCSRIGHRSGFFLVCCYFFVKFLSLLNVVGQFVFLNGVLGTDYHLFGFELLDRVLRGEDVGAGVTAPRFPRVTMCDVKVRRMGGLHRETVMCVLPINLFNEMAYLVVWLWMVFIAFSIVLAIITWSVRLVFACNRRQYVVSHMHWMRGENNKGGAEQRGEFVDTMPDESKRERGGGNKKRKKRLELFIDEYLRHDGVLVLRLIGHNTSALTVSELVTSLWKDYKKKSLVGLDGWDEEGCGEEGRRGDDEESNFINNSKMKACCPSCCCRQQAID